MQTPPRVLVTNDDGLFAAGLLTLVEGLCQTKRYDVRVGAPDSERSGSSHACASLIKVTLYERGAAEGLPDHVHVFSCSGFPADTVRLAVAAGGHRCLLIISLTPSIVDVFEDGWRPDVVISGMNKGLNAGTALVVSGTVGAAREGTIRGAKSIAVSLHSYTSAMRDKECFKTAVRDLLPVFDWYIREHRWPQNVLLNMNFPLHDPAAFSSVPNQIVVAPQGRSAIVFNSELYVHPDLPKSIPGTKTKHYRFRWHLSHSEIDPEGTVQNDDLLAVNHNYVTMTPVAVGVKDDIGLAMKLLEEFKTTFKHPTLSMAFVNGT